MKTWKVEILSAVLVLSLIFLPSSKIIIKQKAPELSLKSFEEKILINPTTSLIIILYFFEVSFSYVKDMNDDFSPESISLIQ